MLPLPLHRQSRQLPWRRRGANICHQRLEHPNEHMPDDYRDNYKTTAIIQQFSSPNTPKHNGFSERDGRTIMGVARCMLNGAALPKSLRGKWRPPWCFYSTARQASPSVATLRTTGCSANTSTCSSYGLLGPVPMGTVKHIWRQLCATLDLRIASSRNSNFELIGFSDASYNTGNPEKAKSTSRSMHFLSGRSSTPALASSATARGLCS